MFLDLKGQRFDRLTVLLRIANKPGRHARWKCRCDCGNEKEIDSAALRFGRTRSCGCLQKQIVRKTMTTHGQWRSRTYSSWDAMVQRCTNENYPGWKYYGGRGIKVCDRWRNSFENFVADMGKRPEDTTLDRYPDRDGNYELSNCRWATDEEQHNNTRGNTFVDYQGETLTLTQLGRKVGMWPQTIGYRLRHGWSIDEAVKPKAVVARP